MLFAFKQSQTGKESSCRNVSTTEFEIRYNQEDLWQREYIENNSLALEVYNIA